MFRRWHKKGMILFLMMICLVGTRTANAQMCPGWAVERAVNLTMALLDNQIGCDQFLSELNSLPSTCVAPPPGCTGSNFARAQRVGCRAITGGMTLEQLYVEVLSLPAACFPQQQGGYGGGQGGGSGGSIYRDGDNLYAPGLGACDSSGCYAY